ncbi:hypothetical protein MTO96_024276 [Rhipicephalus appendiculatus]
MPSKARSESNLFGDPRRQREVAMLVPNLHLLLARRGEGVLRKLVRNVLPPSLYRKELQKQIEEKQQRLDEQRRRDEEEEEKLERRVQQQQAKMYQEYQEERKRHRAKDQVTRPPEDSRKIRSDAVPDFRPPRRRSESRDRLANNVEILRRQLATEQQINRIQQMQRNYVVTEAGRCEDSDC